ncbi:MAG: hypothetical protein ACK2UO_07095 [Caldilineaceae bacterium]
MKLTTQIMTISTLVATAALALGYGLAREPIGVLAFIALGLLWLVGQKYQKQTLAGLGLLGFAVGALLGTLYGVQDGWLLVGITAALVTWDLHHFIQHIRVSEPREATPTDTDRADTDHGDTGPEDKASKDTASEDIAREDTGAQMDAERRTLERAHLQRLAIVSGAGLLLGTLALTVKLTLRFGVIFALGLIAVFGLSRLIHYLRQESD